MAAVIEDARRRRRRRRLGLAVLTVLACVGAAIGFAIASTGGGKPSASPPSGPTHPLWVQKNKALGALPAVIQVVVAGVESSPLYARSVRPARP